MPSRPIRIGIVGAGNNTRQKHIPGLRAVPGVEITGVVNRTPESTRRVAAEFDISRTFSDWRRLVECEEIDAVVIGTWPDMHCEVTCAALEAGKHVLCEARMARNAAEAHRMAEAAYEHSDLVKQLVPSPFGLAHHDYVRGLIDEGFLGELRELVVIGATDQFHDPTEPLHWRQEAEVSGLNVLAMGILHETALRWTPPTARVFAQSAVFVSERPPSRITGNARVTVPDSLQIVSQLEGGARGLYHLSGVALFGPGLQVHLYGSQGTIKLFCTPRERLLVGGAGDGELREVELPPEQRGGWRVEEEFLAAIRGEETVRFTSFATGVKYMEFTEAVARSARENRPVELPLAEFNTA